MRLLIALMALLPVAVHAAGVPAVEAVCEYRHDAFEYDAPARDFIRGTLQVSAGPGCGFGASYLQGIDGSDRRYTWHLNAASGSGDLWVLAGNYYASFGSGLLVGKKRIYSPDVMEYRREVSFCKAFAPCRGADQRYSFHGLATGARWGGDSFSISAAPFCSVRYRFTHIDSGFYGTSRSSLATVAGTLSGRYPYVTPVILWDAGFHGELRAGEVLRVEAYYLRTGMMNGGDRPFYWDMSDRAHPRGALRSLSTLGLFVSLRLEGLGLYVEAGFPCREQRLSPGYSERLRGFGIQYGAHLRLRSVSLFVRGREVNSDFYAPYGAGSSSPVRRWEGGVAIRPWKRLECGFGGSLERRLRPSTGEDSIVSVQREHGTVRLLLPGRWRLTLQGRRVVTAGDRRLLALQVRVSLRAAPVPGVSLSGGARAQRRGEGGASMACSIRTAVAVSGPLSVTASYTGVAARQGNEMYINEATWMRSPASGTFADGTSHLFLAGVRLRTEPATLTVQYRHQFLRGRSRQWRIEASCAARL
ncbi:MAG: hypothetical protein JXA20_04855 [Spirochaetes bacterium]|nr:hypothetical protein [Spirochaetota bacterium]